MEASEGTKLENRTVGQQGWTPQGQTRRQAWTPRLRVIRGTTTRILGSCSLSKHGCIDSLVTLGDSVDKEKQSQMFDEVDEFYTGPPIDMSMVRSAEGRLGFRLPESYVQLLFERNGGMLVKKCVKTAFPTSWARDHFQVRALLGVGPVGIDSEEGGGSNDLIAEWGYPKIGIVICDTPSGGHDTVMLDYTDSGPKGEPAVAYIDEDRVPRRIARSFQEFVAQLIDCRELDSE